MTEPEKLAADTRTNIDRESWSRMLRLMHLGRSSLVPAGAGIGLPLEHEEICLSFDPPIPVTYHPEGRSSDLRRGEHAHAAVVGPDGIAIVVRTRRNIADGDTRAIRVAPSNITHVEQAI